MSPTDRTPRPRGFSDGKAENDDPQREGEGDAQRWEPFPNLSTAGSYSYFSQVIELNSISEYDVHQALTTDDISAKLKLLPLLEHELQHLADHLATVWGRENLVSLFDAYNVRARGMRAEFGRVTQILRDLRRIHCNDYYTEYGPAADQAWDGRPWMYDLSSGVQLDVDGSEREDQPIVFTRFDTQDGDRVVRVPFTVASLFEVRAVAAEMKVQIGLMNKLEEAPRMVEIAIWERKTKNDVYEPYLVMYSVAAHYLSNIIRPNKDVVSTYRSAAVIAGLCLNMPRSLFPLVKPPTNADKWGPRNEALKGLCDRGYLYFALIANGRDIPMDDVNTWLEQALPASGLPRLAETRAPHCSGNASDWQECARRPHAPEA